MASSFMTTTTTMTNADHQSRTTTSPLGASGGTVAFSSFSCFPTRIPEAAMEPIIEKYFHFWLSSPPHDSNDDDDFDDDDAVIEEEEEESPLHNQDQKSQDHRHRGSRSGSRSSSSSFWLSFQQLQQALFRSTFHGEEASVFMILLHVSRTRRRTTARDDYYSSNQSSTNVMMAEQQRQQKQQQHQRRQLRTMLQFQDVKHGETALHIAASAGHVAIVQLFLDLDNNTSRNKGDGGEEENIAMDHPPPPDDDAQEQPQPPTRRIRPSHPLVMIADDNGKTALHVAIARRQVAIIHVLLQYMQHYCSPLERCAILHGKTLDTGSTPLIVAAHWGLNSTIVQLLYQMKNSNWNDTNEDSGGSATSTTIQILLREEKDHSCSTPLIAAVRAGHESTVQLLLDYGAPVKNCSSSSSTSIETKEQAVDASTTTTSAITTTTTRVVSRRERSALHCAVELGMESMVQLLLNHGANVMATTSLGIAPLYEAIQLGYDSIVGLLLQQLSLSAPPTRLRTPTTSEEVNVLHHEKSGKIGGLEQDSICDTIGNLDSRSISVESS
jgi:ankyrin repeat protein